MIVVLTDGQFAQSNAFNDSALQVAVSSLNLEGVVVFFFSLGSGDADNPPDPLTALRTLSCQMNSIVSYVSLSNAMTNALWTIRPYFDYQATLRYKQNTTYWTDTYPDYEGLGNVSTVTYPGMQISDTTHCLPYLSREYCHIAQRFFQVKVDMGLLIW